MIPRLELKTRLCLVIHVSELKRTTNTGTLALRALPNSEMLVRGRQGEALNLTKQVQSPDYRSLLFYPSDDAIELTPEFVSSLTQPVQLIVPDGNWRQAGKVHYNQTELKDVQRVMIKTTETGTRHLRFEHKPEGMATLQAIAHAMGVLEGPKVKDALMQVYQLKLDRTLEARGHKL
jgi:DTW domain-containing protein YfiP